MINILLLFHHHKTPPTLHSACGHVCAYSACADLIQKESRKCTMCKVVSEKIIKVFL